MTAMNFKMMNSLRFNQVNLWDYLSHFKQPETLEYHFPVVQLNEVIAQRKKYITIDDDIEYKRCRVQLYAKGVGLRDEVKGIEIKTKKQQVCRPNDFLVAEIDAKSGGYGIVPHHLDGAVVSNHYFLYEINEEKLLPSFLELYIKTDAFFQQIKAVGSTNYAAIRSSHVLGYSIVLPDLDTQNQLVNQYNKNLAKAQKTENQSNELEKSVEINFLNKLGIEKSKEKDKKIGLQFIRLKDLEKWGVDKSDTWIINPKYKEFKIEDICKVSSGGTPNRNNRLFYENGTIPWIKTGELNNGVIYSSEEKITEIGLKNSSAKFYDVDSVIIAMYGATIGKTAKLGIAATTNQACAVLFSINNNLALTDYIWVYLQCHTDLLKSMGQGSAQPNLNASIIKNFNIQIPDIETQDELISHFFETKEQIKNLRQQAEKLRKQAKENFEKEIFVTT